jgi:hypothetical protein
MKTYRLSAVFMVLVLATLACGININLPSEIKTGPTETEEIFAEVPNGAGPFGLTLAFGAGEIELEPGAEGGLISGSIRYNVMDFKPEISTEGDNVYIEQGNLNVSGLPNFEEKVINEWDLKLANEPMNLSIKAGAYEGRYELGGLSLNRLSISDGAADVDLNFSQPNQIELKSFDYSTGASSVTLEGLANANPTTMTFRSGAGRYRLDFSGTLQRDMEVLVESGISNVVIIVPKGVLAEVRFEGGLTNINAFGDWEEEGNGYYQQDGEGFKIEIRVKMGAGNLELRN